MAQLQSKCNLAGSTRVASKGKAMAVRPASRVTRSRSSAVQVKALFTPPGPGGKDKKFLSREEEPDEYWVAKSEKEGANPFKDPIAIVGILAIFFPFVLLGIAIAAGVIDISVYR